MRSMKLLVLMVVFNTWVWAGEGLKLVEKWQPGKETVDSIKYSLVDKDGHLVMAFERAGQCLVKPDKIIKFAPLGQGPDDLMKVLSLFSFDDGIAFGELPGKIKIFKKEGDMYRFKETRWYKMGYFPFILKNGIYYDRKFFLTGYNIMTADQKKNSMEVSFIEIFSDQGQPLKSLLKKSISGVPRLLYEMNYYLVSYKKYVFYLVENELKVRSIDIGDLEIKKEVDLEKPGFYKPMPDNFYIRTETGLSDVNIRLKNLEFWRTSYSRIHKVLVEGDYLVLQMRTCDPKLKKFALLFYHAGTFKLEKTILTNDYLIGVRAGRYYFFANGDPGLDEGAEDFVIHVCILEK